MGSTTINLRDVSPELTRRMKSAAALKGQTIKQFVLAAIEQAVSEAEKKAAKK